MIVEKVGNLLTRANRCAEESKSIQSQWKEVENEIFSILMDTHLRPKSAVISIGDVETYFKLDWEHRQMFQVPKEAIVIDLKRVSDAGMIIANSGNEENQDGD